MRIFVLGMVVAAAGCATTVQPFVPSAAQQARFDQVVRAAEAAEIDGPGQAASLLADAKSDWVYAQHLPRYPERARQIAAKAMRDAETALTIARRGRIAAEPPVVPATTVPATAPRRPSTQVAAAERRVAPAVEAPAE